MIVVYLKASAIVASLLAMGIVPVLMFQRALDENVLLSYMDGVISGIALSVLVGLIQDIAKSAIVRKG